MEDSRNSISNDNRNDVEMSCVHKWRLINSWEANNGKEKYDYQECQNCKIVRICEVSSKNRKRSKGWELLFHVLRYLGNRSKKRKSRKKVCNKKIRKNSR